jgi:hypothetical protein
MTAFTTMPQKTVCKPRVDEDHLSYFRGSKDMKRLANADRYRNHKERISI